MLLKNPEKYRKRIMDSVIEKHLSIFGGVYLKGPKWCGKTYCCERLAESEINLTDNGYAELAEINPSGILSGITPRFIDEWQLCASLWNKIKTEISARSKPSQFLLSGSVNVPSEERSKINHSGAGRIDKLVLRTCSLYETGHSNGEISIHEMFTNPDSCIGKISNLPFEKMVYALCAGGWPYQFEVKNDADKLLLPESYINSIVDDESGELNQRQKERTKQFLRSIARNVQTMASDDSIIKDFLSGDLSSTRNEYFELKKIFKDQYLLDYTLAWNPNIRSKTSIRTTPKISFTDPSIAVAALGISPEELMMDFNTLGYLFENLVSRDVKIYLEAEGGSVYQYHDRTDLECDLVLKNKKGEYGLVEVKLGSKGIDAGAANLSKIQNLMMDSEKIGRTKLHEPKFLAVITSTEYAYKREDGVYVLPIGCLKN